MRPLIALALGLIVAGITYIVLFVGRREKNLPPGPPTIPVLGNLHQIPKKGAHHQFTAWARKYGGIYSLKLGTGTAVVSPMGLLWDGGERNEGVLLLTGRWDDRY